MKSFHPSALMFVALVSVLFLAGCPSSCIEASPSPEAAQSDATGGETTAEAGPRGERATLEIVEVAAGEAHTVALAGNGSVWTCGNGGDGQLGWEQTEMCFSGRRVEGLPAIRDVAAGTAFSVFLAEDGELLGSRLRLRRAAGTDRRAEIHRTGSTRYRWIDRHRRLYQLHAGSAGGRLGGRLWCQRRRRPGLRQCRLQLNTRRDRRRGGGNRRRRGIRAGAHRERRDPILGNQQLRDPRQPGGADAGHGRLGERIGSGVLLAHPRGRSDRGRCGDLRGNRPRACGARGRNRFGAGAETPAAVSDAPRSTAGIRPRVLSRDWPTSYPWRRAATSVLL